MDWTPFVTPTVILATAIVAWVLQRRIASRRATLDFIAKLEIDNPEWARLRSRFAELRDGNRLLSIIASETEKDPTAVIEVASFLNHFELVAVAIKHHIINEDLYKEWFKTSYLRTWHDSEAFIVAMRKEKDHPALFQEFESLAKEWRGPIDQ